jgi:hypothetical protein
MLDLLIAAGAGNTAATAAASLMGPARFWAESWSTVIPATPTCITGIDGGAKYGGDDSDLT